jgi:hypothetical protein
MWSSTGGAMGTTLTILNASPAQASVFFYLAMLGLLVVANVNDMAHPAEPLRVRNPRDPCERGCGELHGHQHTTLYKVLNWSISAVLTSLAGSFYAYWMSFISPDEMFNVMIAVNAIVILLVGGLGRFSDLWWEPSSFSSSPSGVEQLRSLPSRRSRRRDDHYRRVDPNGFVGRFSELRRNHMGQTKEEAR